MSHRHKTGTHLFTSESVSMGHPDKVADQISDALLDSILRHDPKARVAIETLVTTNYVLVAGEVTVHTPEAQAVLTPAAQEKTVRETVRRIGYNDPAVRFDDQSLEFKTLVHGQSENIARGVIEVEGTREQGAGDQGMMFGFACDETRALMPLPIHLSHRIVERLALLRQRGEIPWLRPDAKSQVTVVYEGSKPVALHTIVCSTQHTEEVVDPNTDTVTQKAKDELIARVLRPVIHEDCPQLADDSIVYHINPTGKFVVGGPDGDCGLTGRKIIVDTYGGRGRHGGGAFSGKDPTKVDRSAAYMARHIAKNMVAAGIAHQCEVQLAYAIGVAEPVSVSVDTFGTSEVPRMALEKAVRDVFPLKPGQIIRYLDLRRPIYFETARHGHFGREGDGFTWERTHRVEDLKSALRAAM